MNDSLAGQGQGHMIDVLGSQSVVAGVSEQCRQQYEARHCHTTTQHFVTVFLGVYSESLASACQMASHCNAYCLLTHVLILLMGWSLRIPEKCEHHFSCCWLRCEPSFDRECQVFSFYTLEFAL